MDEIGTAVSTIYFPKGLLFFFFGFLSSKVL